MGEVPCDIRHQSLQIRKRRASRQPGPTQRTYGAGNLKSAKRSRCGSAKPKIERRGPRGNRSNRSQHAAARRRIAPAPDLASAIIERGNLFTATDDDVATFVQNGE